MKGNPKTKTAAEWLLHLPPKYREAVKAARNEYRADENGAWDVKYTSLRQMVGHSTGDTLYDHPRDQLWDELYYLIRVGDFKEPWREVEPQPELTVYEKYPIGSKWLMQIGLEVEVTDNDPYDKHMPIYVRGDGHARWLTPSELDKLKPLNPLQR